MTNSAVLRVLAVVGALTILWLFMLGAVAAYDAMSDGAMMDDMGDMRGMMEGMMGGDREVTTGSASGQGAVRIVDFDFKPSRLTVTAGTVIEWSNEDSAPHSATARDDSFDSGRLDDAEAFQWTFDSAGRFEYFCTYHPWMEGEVIVQ